ncbi:TPA: hypothetical protein RQO71_001383 [Klebsiella michiganensis]|nr:hypothetical protein [Klebsiella michiganensis]
MTDITELAQHMKAAAVLAKKYRSLTLTVSVGETLALVEALEKAQETIAFQQREIKALLSSLEPRTVKLPLPGFITISGERMAVYLKGDVDAAMLAAGIEEAE